MRLLALFLALACANVSPEIRARAGIRREAESRLASCLGITHHDPIDHSRGWRARDLTPGEQDLCLEDSIKFCRSKHLEVSCGIDGLWGSGF